jgi:hypothetical protein
MFRHCLNFYFVDASGEKVRKGPYKPVSLFQNHREIVESFKNNFITSGFSVEQTMDNECNDNITRSELHIVKGCEDIYFQLDSSEIDLNEVADFYINFSH